MSATPTSPTSPGAPSAGSKLLQERLHYLLSRLSASVEVIKTWPQTDGDDASIHVKTTTKLIKAILETKRAIEKVEGVIKADNQLRKALQECPVPINLLDLLDHGRGLNPDCFSRGLLREAMGQLAGLKRRKLALEMLGAAVQSGLNRRLAETQGEDEAVKRKIETPEDDLPPTKRVKREQETTGGETTDAAGV
eukprot:Nitzschia sp. Nitz4//scaffold41_size133979//47212//47930//NITZ4_003340-RA/size133979-snap-gene-0.119-mRNA-1//-1//CDS//3329551449//8884//frame0